MTANQKPSSQLITSSMPNEKTSLTQHSRGTRLVCDSNMHFLHITISF